jgi:hypothetical protein
VTDFTRVRKITPTRVVTTIAGSGLSGSVDGLGTNARFSSLFGIAIDKNGTIYVADNVANRIRKLTPPPA